jgi:hypothetical protein
MMYFFSITNLCSVPTLAGCKRHCDFPDKPITPSHVNMCCITYLLLHDQRMQLRTRSGIRLVFMASKKKVSR